MRRIGQILIGLSVAGAVIGGLSLSTGVAQSGGDLGNIAPTAALWLFGVTGLAAAGIFFYQREPHENRAARSETELQRRISDALGVSDQLSFSRLADALDTDAQAVARLVSELTRLEVLPAAVAWDSAIIYPKNRGYLAHQTVCLHCGEPISPHPKSTTCLVCRTVHYDV